MYDERGNALGIGSGGNSGNLGIDNLTVGASLQGTVKYIEELKTGMINDVFKAIDNTDEVITAINNCWQGESKDRFLSDFALVRETIKADLQKEYENVEAKINNLVNAILETDNNGIYNGGEN